MNFKIKFFYTFLILLFLCSCEEFSFEIENINGNEIQVLGHGGMGIHSGLPMNSFASVEEAIDEGADGVELDVQLSKDNVLVAFHDTNLSESTNSTGVIRDWDWTELSSLNYSDYHLFSNYPIASIEEITDSYSDYIFSFDCKLYTDEENLNLYYEAFSMQLMDLVNSKNLKCSIESNNVEFLKLVKSKLPECPILYYPTSFQQGLDVVLENSFEGLSISTEAICAEQVKEAHNSGVWITLWNVRTRSRCKEAILKNPDCIQADRLNYLLDLLE